MLPVPARSVFIGFEPYYFNPAPVQKMMNVILIEEWQLQHLLLRRTLRSKPRHTATRAGHLP